MGSLTINHEPMQYQSVAFKGFLVNYSIKTGLLWSPQNVSQNHGQHTVINVSAH